MVIYTRGATPVYRPLPPKPVPDDGYPNSQSIRKKLPSRYEKPFANGRWRSARQHL